MAVVAICATGYFVGKVDGVHAERQRAWQECDRKLEAVRGGYVRMADPCLTRGK